MTTSQWQRQLDAVLSEDVAAARERERSSFDQFAGSSKRAIVLYGAGNIGRKVARVLRQNGMEVVAFADRNTALAHTFVDHIPVLSPDEAVRRFGKEAAFVICVWHPAPAGGLQQIVTDLTALGATRVAPFLWLFWKYADELLPYYLWDLPSRLLEQSAPIREALRVLEAESHAQYVGEIRLRISGDFRVLQPPTTTPQYFPRELFQLQTDECFIDCGAYDGDTIRVLTKEAGGEFGRIIAFEADADNITRLKEHLSKQSDIAGRVTALPWAVAAASGQLRFTATAGTDAAISHTGDTIVDCVSLDDYLGDVVPTMIKMDIEGSELDALRGAERTVRKHQPLLAICVYHRPDHLWSIPLSMKSMEPDSKIYLRSYAVDGWESVSYAVPPHRIAQAQLPRCP